MPVHVRVWDDLPRVLVAYLVISSEKPSVIKYPKVVKEYTWQSISMSDLKEIKQAIVSYGLQSPFVSEMVKTWASSNKATPHDWLQLISVVLENRPQQLWKCY